MAIPLLSIKAASTVSPCLAIAITAIRLIIQCRRSQLWWEDLWAAVAMAWTMSNVAAFWWLNIIVAKPNPDKSLFVVAWWLGTLTFTAALWAARMSLTCSIIRISHPTSRLRMVANLTAGLFACCFTSQIIEKLYICRDVKSWMNDTTQGCDIGNSAGIAEICMDVVADSLLMVMASRLLRDARQLKSQRKLVHGLFSASILTTVFSIVHIVFVIRGEVLLAITISGQFEVAISLIVCNLPVVVTCFYRHFRRMHAEDAYDYAKDDSSDRPSLENTLDSSAVTQTDPIYSTDLMTYTSTQ